MKAPTLLFALGVAVSGCSADELIDWRGTLGERVWQALPATAVTQELAASVDRQGTVFLISGGSCASAYDGVSWFDTGLVQNDGGIFMSTRPIPRAAAGAVVIDGKITVVGGCNASAASAAVETYDFFSDVWAPAPNDMPTARYGFAIGVIDGAVYVAGGADSTGASLDTFEKMEFGSWVPLPPLPRARQFPAGAVLDGKLYVIGGRSASGTLSFNDVDIYDPATNAWSSGRPMPTGRATGAAALDGVIFVVSGTEAGVPVPTVQIYDPFYDVWSEAPSIPTPRVAAQPAVIGSSIYVAGNVAAGEADVNAFEALVLADGGGATGNHTNPAWSGTWNQGGGPCTNCGGPNDDDGGSCNCRLSLQPEHAPLGWIFSIAALFAAIVARRRLR